MVDMFNISRLSDVPYFTITPVIKYILPTRLLIAEFVKNNCLVGCIFTKESSHHFSGKYRWLPQHFDEHFTGGKIDA